MANEVKVTTEVVINSSVTGITRKSRILESYEDDLGDFDTPEDTGSTTIDTTVDDIDNEINPSFVYAVGDILFIKNIGTTNYVDIGIEEQSSGNKVYFARLQPGYHLCFPIGPNFNTNMWGKTGSGTTDISVTVVQTS
jgi:hypothetical protein